jgi:hypothetical protein
MLDARADAVLRPVRRRLGFRERMTARRAHMDAAAEASLLQCRFICGRTIGAVAEHVLRGVAPVQKPVELAAVMHRRVGHRIASDQLVRPIHVHVVLVTEEALAMLLGPTRVFIFLAVLRRFPLPLRRRIAALDGLVLLARIALLRHRHNARIHDLPAARDVALRVEMLVKLIKQRLDQPDPRQLLAEQPQRRAVRNAILRPKTDKSRERRTIPNLIFNLLVRQIVQRLQHQHPEHYNDINRLAAGLALLCLLRCQHHRLNVCPEALPRHQGRNRLQRIAFLGQRRKPPVRVEKSQLPHRSAPPNHVLTHVTRTARNDSQLFEAPLNQSFTR